MKGSKMGNTFHAKLEIQSYLMRKYISPEDAKLVFALKTCMASLCENFCRPHGTKIYSLCFTHLDNQQIDGFQLPCYQAEIGGPRKI
jgi:hypothetical protein